MKQRDREDLRWREISVEHVVRDEWIDFRRLAYRMPDGSEFAPYYAFTRRDYVVIVALTLGGQAVCVRQFRQGIREVTTEFPAGALEFTGSREHPVWEDPEKAAQRELLEETGCRAQSIRHLISLPADATLCDNLVHVYLATGCTRVAGQHLDETEFLNVELHSPEEVEEMIHEGRFQQAVHVMAWLLAMREVRRGKDGKGHG